MSADGGSRPPEFPDNPGRLDRFDWPVSREQALEMLDGFTHGTATLEERTCANIVGLVMLWILVFVVATAGVLFFVQPDSPSHTPCATSASRPGGT